MPLTGTRTGPNTPNRLDSTPEDVPSWSDEQVTLATVSAIADRASAVLEPEDGLGGLPHPVVTDATLSHFLAKATTSQDSVATSVHRLGSPLLIPAAVSQAELDDALIHCIHQLDHRTRMQERRIVELESLLTDATRRIVVLEADRFQ